MMVMSLKQDIHIKLEVGGKLPVFMTLTGILITEHIKVKLHQTLESLMMYTRDPHIITLCRPVDNFMMDDHLLVKSPGIFHLTHNTCNLNFLVDNHSV